MLTPSPANAKPAAFQFTLNQNTGGISAWGKTRTDQCKSLRFYHANFLNLDLGQFNKTECEQMIDGLANRPRNQRGGWLTQKSARNMIYVTRLFLQWIDGTDAINWELPRKFDLSKRVQYRAKDITEIKEEVTTIPVEHLKTIIASATDREKLYIGLALNCAYGADQLGRLQCEWIKWKDSQIKGTRLKKMTASRHHVWACNLERLKSVVGDRTTGTVFVAPDGQDLYRTSENGNSVDGISKAWEDHALKRIQKADPEFPRYSFGKLRKTAATMTLAKADPHIASMLLAHKTVSDDELLQAYANLPWQKLFEVQREQERLLVPVMGL